jgi:chromosome partitioning protein
MLTVIGSLKGGSGKSTVTFNIAVWLAMAEAEVVAFDLDPQRTLSDVAEVRAEEGYAPELKIRHKIPDLKKFAGKKDLEVLVDVGAADLDGMKKAISLADRILIPVPPSQADIWSTQRFLGLVSKSARGRRPEVMAFINRADTHHAVRESDEAAAALVSLPGLRFIKARLGQRTVYRRSFSEGLAVFELDPRCKGAREFTDLAAVLFPDYLT